jgi:hypothetical protein
MDREYPEEWDLVAFFGQDPDPLDEEETEFYGCSGFTIGLHGGDVLAFTLQRDGALYITLSRDKENEINLTARDVRSVKIERLHGVETLLAVFGSTNNLQQVRLRLRPSLHLDWGSRFEG